MATRRFYPSFTRSDVGNSAASRSESRPNLKNGGRLEKAAAMANDVASLGAQLDNRCHGEVRRNQEMPLVHLGKGKWAMRPHIQNLAYSILVVFASALVFASIARSAEISPPPDANSRPSDSGKTAMPRTLSDAQIEALMKEIGIRHDSAAEAAPRLEAKAPLLQPTARPPDVQTQSLLREMGHWYDSRREAASKPAAKSSPPSQRTWRRRHWRQYSSQAEADHGEATRLMREELQQRGVAVETAARPGDPK
jgi:hypothetical protein